MSFCPNCGIELREDTKFCPKCGCELKSYFVQPNYDAQLKNDFSPYENKIIQNKSDTKNLLQYNYSPSLNQTPINEIYKRSNFLILLFFGFFAALIGGFRSSVLIYSSDYNVALTNWYITQFLFILALIIWVLSIIAIYFDAKKIGAGSNSNAKGDARISPFWWSVGALLLWILVYPLYLYQRKNIWENNLDYN